MLWPHLLWGVSLSVRHPLPSHAFVSQGKDPATELPVTLGRDSSAGVGEGDGPLVLWFLGTSTLEAPHGDLPGV